MIKFICWFIYELILLYFSINYLYVSYVLLYWVIYSHNIMLMKMFNAFIDFSGSVL